MGEPKLLEPIREARRFFLRGADGRPVEISREAFEALKNTPEAERLDVEHEVTGYRLAKAELTLAELRQLDRELRAVLAAKKPKPARRYTPPRVTDELRERILNALPEGRANAAPARELAERLQLDPRTLGKYLAALEGRGAKRAAGRLWFKAPAGPGPEKQ